MSQQPLRWESYEYYYREKGREWFYIVWIIALAIVAISVIYDNIPFAGVLLVSTFALSIFAARPPRLTRYELSERGLLVRKVFYPYQNLHSFGIDLHTPLLPKLVIKSKKTFMPYIIILLTDIDEEVVRNYLGRYLPEAGNEEPLTNKILEYLGF